MQSEWRLLELCSMFVGVCRNNSVLNGGRFLRPQVCLRVRVCACLWCFRSLCAVALMAKRNPTGLNLSIPGSAEVVWVESQQPAKTPCAHVYQLVARLPYICDFITSPLSVCFRGNGTCALLSSCSGWGGLGPQRAG